jgi:hypothetical protein
MTQPYDWRQAQEAQATARAEQRAAEKWVIDAWRAYAAAEQSYREALATKIVKLKSDGMAVTAAGDIARGEPRIAHLKYLRDVAEGMKEAAMMGGWRASKNRNAAQTFLEWSMRRDLAEYHGREQDREPDDPTVFSGRRAE